MRATDPLQDLLYLVGLGVSPMRRREFITIVGGAAVAWPIAARAQQPAMPRIGVLRPNRQHVVETFAEPFRRYMKAIGCEEGRNIRFVFAWTEGLNERAPVLAGELVAQNVDLIITFGDPAVRAVRANAANPDRRYDRRHGRQRPGGQLGAPA